MSWTARAAGSTIFNREWVRIVDTVPPNPSGKVRSWDIAHSEVSEVNKDPDYTAGVHMERDAWGLYTITDVRRFRKLSDGVLREIERAAKEDGEDTVVTIPKDGGGGKSLNTYQVRWLAERGIGARSITMSGHSSKVSRFLPFASMAEAGMIQLLRGDWNDAYLNELEHFNGGREGHDDMVDSTSDAFNTLCRQMTIPVFAINVDAQASPVPTL